MIFGTYVIIMTDFFSISFRQLIFQCATDKEFVCFPPFEMEINNLFYLLEIFLLIVPVYVFLNKIEPLIIGT